MENKQQFTIFHFNDVYDIQPEKDEPKAGVAAFKSLLDRYKANYQNKITLFSGDAFSPSLLSTEFQGENMIKPLNSFGVDLACFGNHDFDYSLERVKELISMTNFPWMLSNVFDNRTERRLAEALEYKIMDINGVKIGFFSLAEKQWIDTLYPFYKEFCHYVDFIQFADYMVRELLQTHKCDMVIAMTHMMKYNDVKLAQNVKGIDLILGGHDHLIVQQKVCDSVIIKSGTNFRNFSIIEVRKNLSGQNIHDTQHAAHIILSNNKWVFDIKLKQVNHAAQKIVPDKDLEDYVNQIYAKFSEKQEKVALFTKKPIDLRFKTIRKEQTPFLQFLVSFYRHFTSADCSFMNSGNFRMDCEIKPGPITFGVIERVIEDQVVVKQVPGRNIIKALENCVSMYPNLAGRYSALSGMAFEWDPRKPPFQRVNIQSIRINGQHIDLDRIYKVAMHSFMGMGGDGFECFKDCPMSQTCAGILNKHIIHELISLNKDLIDTYTPKYPNRFQIIEIDGHRYLELDLPEPKNVKVITHDD